MEKPLSPHSMDPSDIFLKLKTESSGLTNEEARHRLEKYGPNTFPSKKPPTIFNIFLHQFLNPLIYVLGFAGIVAASLGDLTDAFFILLVLLINAVIGTVQEYGAEKSALALKQMSASQAMVLREGESYELEAEKLVLGDVITLESGSKVPADLRLVGSHNLEIDESLLTGESHAVMKDYRLKLEQDITIGDRKNMAFSGSIVMKGRGKGVVVGTGFATELGKIAESISLGESAKPPLLIRMEEFTKRLTIYLVIITVAMALYLFSKGQTWHEVLMFCVALAVAAIPEGLPVALTVALAIASRRMARRNVIVRKLPAVEALGSCTFIATDKTGTLTVNQLTITDIAFPDSSSVKVTGTGLNPEGEILIEDDNSKKELHNLIRAGVLCNEAQFYRKNDVWGGNGDAVDLAFLVLSHKGGQLPDHFRKNYQLIQEVPYEPENKFAATMHSNEENNFISVKGALERILSMCEVADQEEIIRQSDHMAESGLRVLAVAGKTTQDNETVLFDQLHHLSFLGLVGMIDPLRKDALEAVTLCHQAGIKVAMITGDHPKTSFAIAHELGLVSNKTEVVTGKQLSESDEQQRAGLIEKAKVFARMEPQQKLDVVSYMIKKGAYVAVTGDGANDAPALKKANVGIAMGRSGTDVAKETSDLIITDDKFSSIVSGIEEGRVAYGNIRKVISLLVATGAAEIFMVTLSLLFNTPLPLTAIQLLWLNLVTNGIQHIGLAFEPAEGDELSKPPRLPHEPIFDRIMIERILLSALVIGGVSFWQYQNFIESGMALDEARNYTLLLMVLFENIMVGNCRSEVKSFLTMNPLKNPLLLFGTVGAQLLHIVSMYIPGIANILGLSPVFFSEWIRLLGLSLTVLLAMEIYKFLRFRGEAWR